jgi:hypothetical protein
MDIVVVTVPPPSSCSVTVFSCHGMNMVPIKPALNPTDPRSAFLQTPRGPHLVPNEVSHPLSEPIAIPKTAYSKKKTILRMGEIGST